MLRLFERRTPAATVNEIEVAHDGSIYRVALKRMATSKRFTLRVGSETHTIKALSHVSFRVGDGEIVLLGGTPPLQDGQKVHARLEHKKEKGK